jgi:hypothetical protein
MAMRDLIPWNRSRDVSVRRGEDNPFLTLLHREMNRDASTTRRASRRCRSQAVLERVS